MVTIISAVMSQENAVAVKATVAPANLTPHQQLWNGLHREQVPYADIHVLVKELNTDQNLCMVPGQIFKMVCDTSIGHLYHDGTEYELVSISLDLNIGLTIARVKPRKQE